jgi:hypothetical protein
MYHDIYFLKFFTVRNIFSCKESICTQGQKEIADFVVNKKPWQHMAMKYQIATISVHGILILPCLHFWMNLKPTILIPHHRAIKVGGLIRRARARNQKVTQCVLKIQETKRQNRWNRSAV